MASIADSKEWDNPQELIKRMQDIQSRLREIRDTVRVAPMDAELTNPTITQWVSDVRRDVHNLRPPWAPFPGENQYRDPTDSAWEAADRLERWTYSKHYQDRGPVLREFLGRIDDTTKALDHAQTLTRVTSVLKDQAPLGAKALEETLTGNSGTAHGLIRKMIEMLQGAARDIRGIEPQRTGPER